MWKSFMCIGAMSGALFAGFGSAPGGGQAASSDRDAAPPLAVELRMMGVPPDLYETLGRTGLDQGGTIVTEDEFVKLLRALQNYKPNSLQKLFGARVTTVVQAPVLLLTPDQPARIAVAPFAYRVQGSSDRLGRTADLSIERTTRGGVRVTVGATLPRDGVLLFVDPQVEYPDFKGHVVVVAASWRIKNR